jgi:hypothetical protein
MVCRAALSERLEQGVIQRERPLLVVKPGEL